MIANRPAAVVFDVNETLTDLSGLSSVFDDFGLGPMALSWWFAVVLRDGMALAAAGGAASFPELAVTALHELFEAHGRAVPEEAADRLLAGFGQLPLHPDVIPALELLREAQVPAFALTNGAAAPAARILGRAGARSLFADVISVDVVGHWKPRPEPYTHAAQTVGVEPERLAMVAVHPWDLNGAASVGLLTGWVRRGQRSFPPVFTNPTVQAERLDELVAALLELPAEAD